MAKCSWSSVSGAGCEANALQDDDKCFMHSTKPDVARKRAQARSLGGKSRPRGCPVDIDISSPSAILRTVRDVAQALADNKTDARTASTLQRLLSTAVQAQDLGEVEKELKRLKLLLEMRGIK